MLLAPLAFIGAVIVLGGLAYQVGRKQLLYPPFVYCLVWIVPATVYATRLIPVADISLTTWAIVFGCAMFYALGGFTVSASRRRGRARQLAAGPGERRHKAQTVFKYGLLSLCLLAIPLVIVHLQYLSGSADFSMVTARESLVERVRSGLGSELRDIVFNTLPVISSYLFFLFYIDSRARDRNARYINSAVFLLALLCAILTTGRVAMLSLLAGCAAIYVFRNKRWKLKYIAGYTALFAILFIGLVFVMKNVTAIRRQSGNDLVTSELFWYTVGPLAAFDQVVRNPDGFPQPVNHTFSPLLRVLSPWLNTGYTAPPLLDSYAFVPFPCNVYTAYKFYFLDFGLRGLLIIMYGWGMFQTWLFGRAEKGEALYVFLYVVFLYPVILSMFDDEFFQYLYYAKATGLAILYYRVLRGKRRGEVQVLCRVRATEAAAPFDSRGRMLREG